MKLIPKNWGKFQHYKDRNPPWIKLHRDLLIDKEFMRLPLASKALAPMLWLLASEDINGVFNAEIDEIEFRLRFSQKEIKEGLKPLIDNGFFLDASTMLSPCLQDAIPETEAETKKERKAKSEATPLPNDFSISDNVRQWAIQNRFFNIEKHLDSFILKAKAKGYTYKDWDSAFMNAIRDNWANIPNNNPKAPMI